MFGTFLIVCTGNICRSPMAEALLAHRLSSRGVKARVESAGIAAAEGEPAVPEVVELMRERGLDVSGHRARQATGEMLSEFELVLVMEETHRRTLEHLHPAARGRVQLLGRFGRFEIPDPYGKARSEYERTLGLIERGIADYEKAFWS